MKPLLVLAFALLAATASAEVGLPITSGESGRGPAVIDSIGNGIGVPVSPGAAPALVIPLTTPQDQMSDPRRAPSRTPSPQADSEPLPSFTPSDRPQMNDSPRPDLYRPDLR